MGRFSFRMMANLGELERDQIGERTKSALEEKARKGERRSRHIPYGYDLADDRVKLLKNRTEQRQIRRMAKLREEGATLRGIAADLERRHVSSKNGSRWHPKVIKSILDRQIA